MQKFSIIIIYSSITSILRFLNILKKSQSKFDKFLNDNSNIRELQKKFDEVINENNKLKTQKQNTVKQNEKLKENINDLESEIKKLNAKLTKEKKSNQELEERNYKLMDSLHQDVNHRVKQYKSKALSILAQPEFKKRISLIDSKTYRKNELSFLNKTQGKSNSPLKNLTSENIKNINTNKKENKDSPKKILFAINNEESLIKNTPIKRSHKGLKEKLKYFEDKLKNSLNQIHN